MCLTISLRLDLASKLLFVRVHACPCLRVMPHLSFVECSTRGNFSKLLDCTRSFLFKIDMFFMTSFSWQTRILRVKLSLRGKKSLSFDFVWNTTISYNTYSCKYPRNRARGLCFFLLLKRPSRISFHSNLDEHIEKKNKCHVWSGKSHSREVILLES